MAFEAYKVAVRLSLIETVSAGLLSLSKHFMATGKNAKELEASIKRIQTLMVGGGIAVGAGVFGLKMLEGPLEKAKEYQRYVSQLRQMGLGDAQIQEAEKFSQATKVINTSIMDRMRIFTEAQGSFRQSGKSGAEALEDAKQMMPILATYEVAMKTLSGPTHAAAEGSMRNLNKMVEMMGGLGNTKRAQEIADGAFKAVQSSGRMVDERQLKQFFAYGSSASNQQNLRTVFGGLEPIIGEMGGSTVGTGMRTAYNRVNGTMSLIPKSVKRELARLHMADKTGDQQTGALARLQASDIIGYTEEMMRRYKTAGITSQIDRERENSILFGTNGAKIYNKIMQQMSVIHESLAAYDKARGASEVANDPNNVKLTAMDRFHKKLDDLQLILGKDGGLIDMAARGLDFLGRAIERVTNFASRHPALTKLAVEGAVVLSVLSIVGGALMMLRGAFMALGVVFKFVDPLYRIGFLFGRLVGWAMRIGALLAPFVMPALEALVAAVGAVSAPIWLAVAAVVGVSTAAYELWKHWDTLGPKIKAIWDGIVDSVENAVVGLWNKIKSILPSFGHHIDDPVVPGAKVGGSSGTPDSMFNLGGGNGKSPYVAPAASQGQTVNANLYLTEAGKQAIAGSTTKIQTKQMSRGMNGGSFDLGLTQPVPAMNNTLGW